MRRIVLNITTIGAWFAVLWSLDAITSDGNVQVWLALSASCLLGFLVNRWWILAAPAVTLGAVWSFAAIVPPDPCVSCEDDITPLGAVVIGILVAVGGTLAVGAGLALRRVLAFPLRKMRRRSEV